MRIFNSTLFVFITFHLHYLYYIIYISICRNDSSIEMWHVYVKMDRILLCTIKIVTLLSLLMWTGEDHALASQGEHVWIVVLLNCQFFYLAFNIRKTKLVAISF